MARRNRFQSPEARQSPRVRVSAPYTFLRLREPGVARYAWTGYVYDLSELGMRFEVDDPLPAGQRLEIRALLPGPEQVQFQASGVVVRRHDEANELGPVRMGLRFEEFKSDADRDRLHAYVNKRLGPMQAAA